MPTAIAEKNDLIKRTTSGEKPEKAPRQARGDSGFAVIETGGKQYRVAEGDTIKIEKINVKGGEEMKEGDEIVFDKVILKDDNAEDTLLQVGTPYITEAKVVGTITEIGRNKKVVVIHYKQKSRYFKKAGHRQPYFKVKIKEIS